MKVEITEIVEQCLTIEKMAITLYAQMSEQASAQDLKDLWWSMSTQEEEHVEFWEKLLNTCKEKKIWNIFENPGQVLKELKEIDEKVNKFLEEPNKLGDIATSFLAAYRLEIIMLHPAFSSLFILMKKFTNDNSPADEYDKHIATLLSGLSKQGAVSPEFELIDDLARRLWARNKEIAEHLAKINALHGVVPICVHCKRIRDDEGYWNNVEKYLKSGVGEESQFSHGICPDCLRKYYGDYTDD